MAEQFDYVVIGAGSAGCILANRLSADPGVTVALVEAGGRDRKLEIKLPAAFPKLFHTPFDWDLYTAPQKELDARELYWPRGKTWGGSSSLNAQMWVRGAQADYDAWGDGWSYAEVLPYFRRAEHRVGSNTDSIYGTDGPLYIEELRSPNPLRSVFFEACAEAGFRRLPELNAAGIDGYGPTPVTQHRGRRWSTADGYLRPALKRPNLTVLSDAHARRILLSDGRATGLEYSDPKGGIQRLTARREILLAAGAVHSPHLLQVSGIGDPDVLKVAGIETLVDSPEVGANLQDHLSAVVIMHCPEPITLVAAERPAELVKFLTTRRGMLTSNVGEAVTFARSDPSLTVPDLEFIFAPVPFMDHGQTDPPGHGLTIGAILLQPESRGAITAVSADPLAAPHIEPNYLSDPRDLAILVNGVEQCQALFGSAAMAPHVSAPMRPGPGETDMTAYVRAHAETLYHPSGTCRMGADADSVVDLELRVRGVEGLRVVDASVMPRIIRGHTHAPTVMIAEKAADLIRAAR
ncbi:GMC family oxidoreductase N-terminal domain-containing protein [Jatrophihabitans sp.]|uniref:GMC family oxidoreductase n=1 Tax=Jatrophihabitans sp. TaxID=1932789 RepID=UPI0030C73353|nr:Choline dehydrogenase [Jatrophihabitans sp.]